MSREVETDDDEQIALKFIVQQLERDDQYIRERNIRRWKKAEEYWRLNQFIYWSEVALDYRNIQNFQEPSGNDDDNEQLAPKTFPIYRAYGESIIAAMASTIPTVLFFPDDASNPDDITTAKAYSLISELLQRHNQAPLLLIHMLQIMYNQGLCGTYVHWDDDDRYGTIPIPRFTNEKVQLQQLVCPRCGNPVQNVPLSDNSDKKQEQQGSQFKGELTPEEQAQVAREAPFEQTYVCPNCGYEGQLEAGEVFEEVIPRLTGYSDTPKGRIFIESYGPLNLRISSYAKRQEDVGLLELQLEMHYAAAREEFPNIKEDIRSVSDFYSYERWGRTSSELLSDQLFNQVTVRYCWVRNWGFEAYVGQQGGYRSDTVEKLKRKFPHGACVIFVNDTFAKAFDESLDDHWTLSTNPLDSFIHGIPLGGPALDIQDAFNEAKNLGLQKHQFGIPETFADSAVLDEEAYRQQMAGPGYVTFATAPQGQPLEAGFYQTRTSAMNEEDIELWNSLNADMQFLLGAVPSIFGGAQVSGSKTATEYNQSRNFALQRLSNHWTNMKFLWANTMAKACRLYATHLLEDEKFVRRNGNAFETVWIRKAELTGRVGNVEPDPSEQFPLTWSQKRDLFMSLITLQNPVIGQIMLHPNNAQNTKDALGFPEFYMPGETDRTKQLIEIRKLSLATPQDVPPDAQQSTVPVDHDVDDHGVHIQVLKLFCTGQEGLYLQETNPAGYLNCILHLKEHQAAMQQLAMQQMAMQPPPGGPKPAGQQPPGAPGPPTPPPPPMQQAPRPMIPGGPPPNGAGGVM
jgi:hypothetical protein